MCALDNQQQCNVCTRKPNEMMNNRSPAHKHFHVFLFFFKAVFVNWNYYWLFCLCDKLNRVMVEKCSNFITKHTKYKWLSFLLRCTKFVFVFFFFTFGENLYIFVNFFLSKPIPIKISLTFEFDSLTDCSLLSFCMNFFYFWFSYFIRIVRSCWC